MAKLEILGDSILKGVIYSAEQQKYRLCDDNAYSSLTAAGFTVANKARMGATIDKGLSILERSADSIDKDTIVLFEYGGNDCDFDWQAISDNPKGNFEAKTPEKAFIEKYKTAVDSAMKKGATVVISSLIPLDPEKYMNWISRNLNYTNILSWLGDISMLYRWQEYYSHMVENVAHSLGCRLLDLRQLFLLDHNYKNLLCADGIHPTQQGHDKINGAILNFLNNVKEEL